MKARILNPLRNDTIALRLGNRIWEACSDMSKYVQMGFADIKLRECIFSADRNTITAPDFNNLAASVSHLMKKDNDSLFSINDILRSDNPAGTAHVGALDESGSENDTEKFSSVIDFPNFLLQVLRVITGDDIPLDAKVLLSTFPQKPDSDFSRNFLYQLLMIRYLFDKFIIKRDLEDERRKNKWNILKIKVQ